MSFFISDKFQKVIRLSIAQSLTPNLSSLSSGGEITEIGRGAQY